MRRHGAQGNEHRNAAPNDHSSRPSAAPIETRILLIEDSATDAELSQYQLRKGGIQGVCRRVDNETALREALSAFHPTVILSDFSLPNFDGLAALGIVREQAPDVPFIFVSGTIGEERAIEALKRGAVDYVLKSNLTRLAPAITRALDEAAARRERTRQEAQIARLTRVLRMLSGINSAVVRIRERNELLDEARRLAVTIGGYTTATVTFEDRPSEDPGDESDDSIIHRVFETGTTYVCGQKSVVALPLLIDKTTIAVLMLSAPDVGTVSDEELQMLHEVAANLSFALQYLQKDRDVRFLSWFDPHTGLAKRTLFCERLERVLSRAGNRQTRQAAADFGAASTTAASIAVAIVDIEQLSVINDSFGRHTGDLLLQHAADRLRRQFHDTEHLAHLGGGTFAVALEEMPRSDAHGARSAQHAMTALHEHLAAVFEQPFEMEGRLIPIVVKSGLARYPHDGRDANGLVQNAEAALRNARKTGQRNLHYNAEHHTGVVARLALEHKLRTALAREQFVLHYQPKVNVQTGRIDGAEALIRWQDPDSGLISPAAFLPILESTGLIIEVGDWVIEQAAKDCVHWQTLGRPALRVAVNISPIQLRRADFGLRFLDAVKSWSSAVRGLDIEITEGALLDDSAAEIERLKLLREGGVCIAIDDFGTGYSSLSRLSELPIDTLKIDRSFVSRLPDDRSGRTLVSTIISLAHAFEMTVVAEGVETQAQLRVLREMGCNQAQGYHFGRPVPRDAFTKVLEQDKVLFHLS